MQRLIARALLVAVAIAAWKVGIHDEWTGLQSVADFFRTWVLLSNAVALVLLIVEANWPSIRNTFELEGLSERLASVVTVTLGISMSMMVLSFLQGLLEGTTAAHDGLVTGAHHGMSPIGHAVREGASIAPIALIVVALGPLAVRWIRNVRTKGVRVNPLSAVRWGLVVALLAGVTVAVTGAAPADAAPPALASCAARHRRPGIRRRRGQRLHPVLALDQRFGSRPERSRRLPASRRRRSQRIAVRVAAGQEGGAELVRADRRRPDERLRR